MGIRLFPARNLHVRLLTCQPILLCSRLRAVVVVPPVSPPTGSTLSQGSILLIEEYDALAAAISSALRKFAPDHAVHAARTLAEAKALAKKIEPELLVIDFDPAFPGLSPFLQKLQTAQPDTRALMLAGRLPPEVAKAARCVHALQFIEKPFDVQDFGAAVQALLGPWRESDTATSRGTLHDLTLADLLVAQVAGTRSVALEVTNPNGKTGEIFLRQGTPLHAEAGRKSGNEALREILEWRDIEVRERERARLTKKTIQADWPDIVAEAARKTRPRPVRATRKAAPPPAPKAGKKLVVVDDTEMLLIFVEDVLMSSGGDFQITTAPNGVSGVKEIERAKPDLVLLDYSLPDINGDEVCRRLLQNDATARIPVLMMSGHVPEMSKAAAKLDNIVATIEKPFFSDALVSLVQTVLTEGRAVRKKAPARKPAAMAPPAPVIKPPPDKIPAPAPASPTQAEPALVLPERDAPEVEPAAEKAAAPVSAAPSTPAVAGQAEHARPVEEISPATVPAPPPPAPPPSAPVKPPVQPTVPPPTKPEPQRSQRPESVMNKARRAFEQLRRQVVPEQKAAPAPEPPAAPLPAPPLPKPPPERPAQPTPRLNEPVPTLQPIASRLQPQEVMPTRVISEGPNEVILSLFLDVLSVQLTPELRIGTIRAKPSSGEVSIHVKSQNARSQLPDTGFKLGQVGLDAKGRIATIRLIPSQTPVKALATHNSLQIGAVSVVPVDSTTGMQLSPRAGSGMTLQLVAHLELAGVELSPTFQVSQIVLKDYGRPIRVTMQAGPDNNGTPCETLDVRLDHTARIKELWLNPIK